jgi:NADPH:quinone reductase-like Zn-dependent oxidoreductase
MKAAVLTALGEPLAVQGLPDPVIGTGEVIVDVAATRVINYARDVFSGARGYVLETPVVPGPGGIGRVRATGPDATRLAIGDGKPPQGRGNELPLVTLPGNSRGDLAEVKVPGIAAVLLPRRHLTGRCGRQQTCQPNGSRVV